MPISFTKQCTLTPTRTRPINHILFSHYNWLPGVQLSWKQDWLLSFVKPALLRFTWAKMKEREPLVIRAVRRLKSCISVFEDEHNHCCCRPSVARKIHSKKHILVLAKLPFVSWECPTVHLSTVHMHCCSSYSIGKDLVKLACNNHPMGPHSDWTLGQGHICCFEIMVFFILLEKIWCLTNMFHAAL